MNMESATRKSGLVCRFDPNNAAVMPVTRRPIGSATLIDAIETLGVCSRVVVDLEGGVLGDGQPVADRPRRPLACAKLLRLVPIRDSGQDGAAGPGGLAPCFHVHARLASQGRQSHHLAGHHAKKGPFARAICEVSAYQRPSIPGCRRIAQQWTAKQHSRLAANHIAGKPAKARAALDGSTRTPRGMRQDERKARRESSVGVDAGPSSDGTWEVPTITVSDDRGPFDSNACISEAAAAESNQSMRFRFDSRPLRCRPYLTTCPIERSE